MPPAEVGIHCSKKPGTMAGLLFGSQVEHHAENRVNFRWGGPSVPHDALRSVGIHKNLGLCFKLLMDRSVLTDAQWAKMEPHCLGKPTDPGRSGSDNRRFIEAVLWIVRTGSPWRDLPAHFGNWSTAFRRFSDWRKADVFVKLFQACSDEPDMEYAMVDATIVKVHRHGQGAKGGLRARP
jgi:transposase